MLVDDGEAVDTTAAGRAQQQQLLRSVHAHLRDELTQIRDVVAQVVDGDTDVEAARNLINHLTVRQNYWTLGSFCAAYCRVVTIHHTIEDQTMFPGLASRVASLAPVIERLGREHEEGRRGAQRSRRGPGGDGHRLGRSPPGASARRSSPPRCWHTWPTRRSSCCPRSAASPTGWSSSRFAAVGRVAALRRARPCRRQS